MAPNNYLEKSKKYKGFHYSVLREDELAYLHKRTLEMFVQVKRVFEDNGIPYMICGGTLLGALGSEKGHFIPWDDDFDVCIFEEDYDKAIKCLTDAENGLPDGMVLQCTATDSNYYLGWMKIRDKHSHTYPDAPRFKENGVWIDLYALKHVEKRDIPGIVSDERRKYVDRRMAAGGFTEEEYQERLRGLEKDVPAEYEQLAEIYPSDIKGNAYIIWSASKVVLEEEWVLPLRKTVFEGVEVTTFFKAEEYLRQHYGDDYMSWPEDEKRRVGLNKIVYNGEDR